MHLLAKKCAFYLTAYILLYGYSGSGKTTLQEQFHERYPAFTFLIENFDELSPIGLLVRIGEMVGVDIIHKGSQAEKLRKHFLAHPGYMLFFDNVRIKKPGDIDKLESLRKLNERAHVPIVFSGVQKLYDDLYDDKNLPSSCNIVSRMDEFKLTGMTKQDAGMYLATVSKVENFTITYPAQQALINTALNQIIGGINAFVTILGRCITMARARYYTSEGRTIPDKAKCVRPAVPDGKSYPGAEIVLILPTTPEPVMIDEELVARMLGEYKTHFPTVKKKKNVSEEQTDER